MTTLPESTNIRLLYGPIRLLFWLPVLLFYCINWLTQQKLSSDLTLGSYNSLGSFDRPPIFACDGLNLLSRQYINLSTLSRRLQSEDPTG
jgi:hypothetical protein